MAEFVGFIGIGIMGEGMAKNLATKLGLKLMVWNRNVAKSTEFCAQHEGCIVAETAADVVRACDVTYSMLSTLEASGAVFDGEGGVIDAVTPGKVIVDCATLTPERMIDEGQRIAAKGGRFVEAPVSGTKGPAHAGTLIFLASGDEAAYNELGAHFDAMGKAKHFLGALGAGSRMKLVVNMVMGGMLNCFAEGMALADAAGLSQPSLLQILDQGAMSNPMFRIKGPLMSEGQFAPAFPLKHAQKDMRFALALGDSLGVAMPTSAAANETFKRARVEAGDEDMCAVYKALKPASAAPAEETKEA